MVSVTERTAIVKADVAGAVAVSPAGRAVVIEGWAARFGVLDRENERWVGSSEDAIRAFLAGSAPVLWNHAPELGQLGRVEAMELRPEGIWMRARLPEPPFGSILRDMWQKVRDGLTRGLSLKGKILKRGRDL